MSLPLSNREGVSTPAHTAPAASKRASWISGRAMLLALLLAPVTAYWTGDQLVDVIFSLMVPPVVMTLLVAVLNLGVRRIAPRWALSEGELIIFYAMHTVMGAICAEWMTVINPAIHSYAVYADTESSFREHILPFIHPWFFIPPKAFPNCKIIATAASGSRSFCSILTSGGFSSPRGRC